MEWKIRHGLFRTVLLDGSGKGSIVIRIGGRLALTKETGGRNLCRMERGESLTVHMQGSPEGSAVMTLKESGSIVFAPRAERCVISLADASLSLRQTQKRDFIITEGDVPIGSITGMLCRTTRLNLPEKISRDVTAALYALAWMMLREDDLELV